MLPNQVNNKVDANIFVHSNTHINQGPASFDKHNSDVNYTGDIYADLFYENKTKIDNHFYEYTPTQEDSNNNFIIPTPEQSHNLILSPVVLMKIKAINGV